MKSKKISTLPVTVVVCGKNEAKNFSLNLPKLFAQSHPKFEVIAVDDHSTDTTWETLLKLQKNLTGLKLVSKNEVVNRKGKKQALYSGILKAKHELIVVTDADCYPTSKTWLQQITAPFENNNVNLVLGLAPNEIRGGFWQGLFRYETYFTALQYVSFALNGLPYMGVGRNMAYRKTFFMRHFPTILEGDLSSGDDDLLINLGAQNDTTAIVFHPDAFMLSPTPETLPKWLRQKTRHLSAGFEYKLIHKLLLSGLIISHLLLMCLGVILLFTSYWLVAVLVFVIYFLSLFIINNIGMKKFYCDDLIIKSPIYQYLWFIFVPIIAVKSKLTKTIKWN